MRTPRPASLSVLAAVCRRALSKRPLLVDGSGMPEAVGSSSGVLDGSCAGSLSQGLSGTLAMCAACGGKEIVECSHCANSLLMGLVSAA